MFTLHRRHAVSEENQVLKRNCKALNLAHGYHGDNKLKQKDARPIILVNFEDVDFESNAKSKPKNDSRKDAGCTRQLVYGKIQYKSD